MSGDGMSAGSKGAAVLLMKQMARETGPFNVRAALPVDAAHVVLLT